MSFRLFLGVALAANILVLVICTGETNATSQGSSYSSSGATNNKTSSKTNPKKCHKVRKCPKNEEFSSCPQSLQREQCCSEKGQPYPKYQQKTMSSKEACVCKVNYLRADNGTCIPAEQCPITCSSNEVLDNCPADCKSDYCPESDEDTKACKTPDVCPPPACKCAFNHRRASNGSCIPTVNCPPFDCGAKPNEEYNACPPICPTDDCSQATPEGQCPKRFGRIGIVLPCNPKCRCIEGYWRLDGICVPYGQCPGICPANERYSGCIQGECIALNCTQKDQSILCPRIRPEFCLKGCVCEEGYLRADNGTCVKEDRCPNSCQQNEVFSECTQATCRAENCSQKGMPIACPGVTEGDCIQGCVCRENYLRDESGSCVPEDQCDQNPCQQNEVFSKCTQATCRAENCSQKGMPIACPGVIEKDCIQGCVCRENYLRDESGHCVPEDQCAPKICPSNEEWSRCAQATCRAQNCTQKGKPIACPLIAEGYCIEACVCQEGYLRDETGACVPEDQCPLTCGENEIAENCPVFCNTDYCPKSADEESMCHQPKLCRSDCKCKFNYKRAINGTCIPTRSCPPFDCSAETLGRPNEVYNPCPAICPTDECSLPRVKGQCPYKIGIILECNPKCQCKDGYGRDNGTCVPFEECPDLCPANAEYSSCIQATCRPQNCSDRDDVMKACPAYDADSCEKGCVCQENYYRNEQGGCVSGEECGGPLCPNANEVYTKTMTACPPNTCESLVAKHPCAQNQTEEPGCMCQPGYLRLDLNSHCVPICDCPQMANSSDC